MNLTPRAQRITCHLDLSGEGIEYGPLHRVLLRKPDFSVRYVDYADRKSLAKHYAANPNVDVSLIPETDIVTGGRLIADFLPEESLEFVLASHVMEHVPDLLGWLEANLRVLKRGGRMAVAFPDKRYCFDLRRSSSAVSDIIAAYLSRSTRPTFRQLCDHFWNVCHATPTDCWSGKTTPESAEYVHDRKSALALLRRLVESDDYHDAHCWVFTDAEFGDALRELGSISEVGFELIDLRPTERNANEFYVTIERR